MGVLWILVAISSAIGGLLGFIGFMASQGAPQQAACAAGAVAAAVIPYCFVRAIQEIKKS